MHVDGLDRHRLHELMTIWKGSGPGRYQAGDDHHHSIVKLYLSQSGRVVKNIH